MGFKNEFIQESREAFNFYLLCLWFSSEVKNKLIGLIELTRKYIVWVV